LKSIMPFLVITVLFVLVRLLISSVPDGRIDLTNDPYVFASLDEKIATVSVVLLEYLRLILLPENLIFDYGYNHIPYTTFSNPKALVSIIVHVFLLAWCVYGVFKRKAVGFFLLAYLSGILLLSNLVLNVGPMMADRFAFFPSFFLIAAILLLIRDITHRWFPGKESVIVVILSVVAMPFAYVKSNARVLEWKDSLTLYRADLLKAPDSFRVVAFNAMEEIAIAENLSDSIAKQDKFRFAIGLMEKAYSIYPDYKNMYKEWGFAYYSLGNIDSAEWAWNRLKELFPSIQYNALNEELILNARFQEQMKIYNSSYEKKDYAFLASVLKKALNYKPAEAETWVILGKVHFLKGARDSANYAWREALRLDTANAEAKSLFLMK
ncbi:MAG: tetratricopeptide repeat protein, partial [Bacteroidota bacterium]